MEDPQKTQAKLTIVEGAEPDVVKDVDPFDPDNMRLDALHGGGPATVKPLLVVPVRKPGKSEFFRVHSDPAFVLDTVLVVFDREYFYVDRSLWAALTTETLPVRLYVCLAKTGVAFLWPIRLPGADGRDNRWWSSAHEIAEGAKTSWTRLIPNQDLGGYESLLAVVPLAEPVFPKQSLSELLRLAFKSQYIKDADHYVIKTLQGRM